ncbi:MAG: DUF4340 domain-containing protein [Candidatus Hydrogenedentes bacterium]|nr:DUF4340 domain-containing protein [Candidatus Hydrogenedentota bacterium]
MNVKKMLSILIGILVVLSLVVIFRQAKESERPTLVEQAGFEKLIPENLKKENVVKLELYAGAKPDQKVVIEKEGDKWRVATHFNSPAKKETVEEYLDKILKLRGEFRAEVATDDALADYNLKDDQAFYVSLFTTKEGEPALKLLVGKSPDFKLTFMRKAGERKIYDGGVNLRSEAGVYGDEVDKTPGPDKWLDKDIVRVEKEKITKLAYIMPDKKFTFERREKEVPIEEGESKAEGEQTTSSEGSSEGEKKPKTKKEYEWVLNEGGVGGKFKDSGLQNLLGRFNPLIATSIVDPAKKTDWGLESPEFKLTISREGNSDIVIEGGRPDTSKGGYVRVATNQEDIVYELSKYMFEQIFPKGQDLFDLPGLNLDKEKITQVEISQPETKVVVRKENNEWKVIEPVVDLPIQVTTLNTMVTALSSWKPADYAESWAPVGEFNKVIVFTMEDKTKHTIKVGDFSRAIDGSYTMIDDNPLCLAVSKIDINKILLRPRDIYTLKVLDFDVEKVASVEFEWESGKEVIKKGEGGWKLVKDGNEVNLDENKVKELLNSLSGLQGSDVRPDLKAGSFVPLVSMIINITDSEPIQFSIGKDKNDNVVTTVPKYKGIVQLASDRWNEIQALIGKAKEPKIEEKPPTQQQEGEVKQPSEGASAEGSTTQGGEVTPQKGDSSPESPSQPRETSSENVGNEGKPESVILENSQPQTGSN